MSTIDDITNQLLLFNEKGKWSDGFDFLAKHWIAVRGTQDAELSGCIGEILIRNGYSNWAKNWLFERFQYHPRNGLIMRWLVEAAAELRDHEEIVRYGEIHEECRKIKSTPNEHLMNALLGTERDQRFIEVFNRQKEGLSPRGYRMYSQYCFYKVQDFKQSARIHNELPSECFRWEDFSAHAALSYFRSGDVEESLRQIEKPLKERRANSSVTAYEMFRESDPNRSLEYINSSLERYGYAPISTSWRDHGFDLEHLKCDGLTFVDDERLVSVIMTVHTMNPMFETAVRSILDQTYRNLELLIVDDASTDAEYHTYESMIQHDERARILRQPYNAGTYAARNVALLEATGEFVLFMDSDDWTHPQRIEKAVKRLDENRNLVVAVDSYVRMHKSGKLAMVGSFFVRKCMLGLWRMNVVRDRLGGFDAVRISADSELLERAELVFGKQSVGHVPVMVYIAFYHDESLTGGAEFGFGWRGIVGHRARYAGAFRTWHRREGPRLAEINMMQLNEREQPFRLPPGFQRTNAIQRPVRAYPNGLEIMKSDCTTSALRSFFTTPQAQPNSETSSVHISVCLATYPARFNTVGRTVETLLNQTLAPNEVHIWVNESQTPPPLPNDPRVVVHLAPENNLTDIGKFACASIAPEGIVVLADDDLNYPPDYVERMANEVQRFDGKACVGLHGVVFPLGRELRTIEDYFKSRRVHHYARGLSIHLPCHLLGTGTMAYDSRFVKFDHSKWMHRRMVDLHASVECQRMGVPMVVVPRHESWLKSFEVDEDDESIWGQVKKDKLLQDQMMQVICQVSDWTFVLHDGSRVGNQDLLQSAELALSVTPASSQKKDHHQKDTYSVANRWRQRGRMLYFDALTRKVHFEMPLGWRIEDTHPDLFRLAHYLMMSPWETNILDGWVPQRKTGWRPALSYSGGIDSHACLELMPFETVVMYHERHGFESVLNHSNAFVLLDALEESGRAVVRIRSNQELIRVDRGKNPGFSSDLAVGCLSILLADFLGLNGVAFGMPLENSYLFHGHTGRDFMKSRYWRHHSTIFKKAGLDLILPTAGLSELINLKIVEDSDHGHLAQSCLRSATAGEVCEKCWKCFRKNSLRGMPVSISPEVDHFLNKEPLKQAVSTVFAMQQIMKLQPTILEDYPKLNRLTQQNFEWLSRYHPDAQEFLPHSLRPMFLQNLSKYAVPMSQDEKNLLEHLELYAQNDE